MKSNKKMVLMMGVVILLAFVGYRCYMQFFHDKDNAYITFANSQNGSIVMGGGENDTDKIGAFKRDLEKDKKYWECIHASSRSEKSGDYKNAIVQREEAIRYAEIEGDVWQARAGLGRLYGKIGDNEHALQEFDWMIAYQTKILDEAIAEKNKNAILYREKIINDLKGERKKYLMNK